ncbi:MAG: hypothetical protein ACE5KA_09440 [Nitrososphaerales archaeon]
MMNGNKMAFWWKEPSGQKMVYEQEHTQLDSEGWLKCREKQFMPKRLWNNTLATQLGLNETQIFRVNQFLERFGMIFNLDDSLQTCHPFSLSRQDGFVYILIKYKDKGLTQDVQYTIKIVR